MPFEKPKFGREFEGTEEEEKARERLKNFTEKIAKRLKTEGIPVTTNCRIDMEAFKEIYPKEIIQRDQKFVKRHEEKYYRGFSPEEAEKEKLKKDGEKLEMLKTAIFSKNLEREFIVTRTSSYDDIKNKIDNVILERETGNVVCALDEVSEVSGSRYEEKKTKVLEINKKENGGELKYGLKLKKDKENQMKLELGKVINIPLFYLALPKKHIEQGIKRLIPDFQEKSAYEEKLFSYFITSLSSQIDFLKLELYLNPQVKDSLARFEKAIQKFKKE